jgi:ribose transport system permease protein
MNQTETANNENSNASGENAMRAKIGSILQQHGALVMLVVVCLLATARYEAFLTEENLFNVLRQNSMLGLVALGMTFVILTGGIDLSVGSLLALAGVIAAYLAPYGVFVSVLSAVVATTLLGLVNGVIIAKARIQPFIVTLGMMIAARGLVLAITDEKSVRVPADFAEFNWLGRGLIGDFCRFLSLFYWCFRARLDNFKLYALWSTRFRGGR